MGSAARDQQAPMPAPHLSAEEAGALARRGGAVARKVALAAALEASQPRLLKVLVKVPGRRRGACSE